ncbi:hypothetical protein evm_014503 [Chilo suppressalis]|nr:hypothetical protein evm_014503 [Chilo suppressalis]
MINKIWFMLLRPVVLPTARYGDAEVPVPLEVIAPTQAHACFSAAFGRFMLLRPEVRPTAKHGHAEVE